MDSVGERLRIARDKAGLSLGQVHQYEGIQKGHLSEMERGIKSPTAETIVRLARRYNTSADYLLGLTDTPPPGPEIEEIRRLWAELDDEQRQIALDFLHMLVKLRKPHIIGGEEEEKKTP